MDAIVSARVPVAVKERGNTALRELGATPSQLINAAYEYVLAERKLPKTREPLRVEDGRIRELSPQQQEKICTSLAAMYIGPAYDSTDFKSQLNEARDERYAHLA